MLPAPEPALHVPVLVGVTGHRDLLPTALPAVQRAARAALQALRHTLGDGLHLVVALAEGADQVVADIALELGLPLVAVSPMPLERYRSTMATLEGRAALDRLWAHAGVVLRLELPLTSEALAPRHGSETDEQARERQDAAQYEQLGVLLSRQSHVLLAVWNGADAEPLRERAGTARRTRGGSAHVVAMRLEGERDEVAPAALRGSKLLSGRPPLLELARSGPVLHLVAPRQKDGGATCKDLTGVPRAPGSMLWWSDIPVHRTPARQWRRQVWPRHETHGAAALPEWRPVEAAELARLIPEALCKVARLGAALTRRERAQAAICARQARHLCPDEGGSAPPGLDAVPEGARPALRWLRRLFAAADADALRHQAWLLGAWSPGMRWRRGSWRPLGALLVFATAVPVAAFCFEMYVSHGHSARWLAPYIAAVLTPLLYYGFVVRPNAWQARHQDHRALAEALRVQFFWASAGAPVAVSDNYLGHHADVLGWIRLALRGPALWAAAAALAMGRPATKLLQVRWMHDQQGFFADKARENARAAVWMERGARVSVAALVAVGLLQLTAQLALGHPPHLGPHWTETMPPLLLGVLPAVAAFFVITAEGRAYEAHAHAYARAEAVCAKALARAKALAPDDAEGWRELALALGREALAENATWLEGHRARPVSSRTG